jgi:uncharacterized membrane protein YphA (DoxX/SURF4 family)
MNLTLWILAGILAAAFAGAGAMKLSQPRQKLAEAGMGYVEDFDDRTIKLIGVLEVLAAVGLILPPALGVAPVLAPLAAIGLVLLMIGAAITHVRRTETPMLAINLAVLAVAAFVAFERLGPNPF